jgi:hypothetical protein
MSLGVRVARRKKVMTRMPLMTARRRLLVTGKFPI